VTWRDNSGTVDHTTTAIRPTLPIVYQQASEIYPIPQDRKGWFARVLSRTAAAGALLFAGDGDVVRGVVSARQLGTPPDESLTPEVDLESRDTALGRFVGSSHVIHWHGNEWMEIFHGIDSDSYDALRSGGIGKYLNGFRRRGSGFHSDGDVAFIAASDGTLTGFRRTNPPR
jgi:hypothetical protein